MSETTEPLAIGEWIEYDFDQIGAKGVYRGQVISIDTTGKEPRYTITAPILGATIARSAIHGRVKITTVIEPL